MKSFKGGPIIADHGRTLPVMDKMYRYIVQSA